MPGSDLSSIGRSRAASASFYQAKPFEARSCLYDLEPLPPAPTGASSVERDDAPDPVLALHQLKAVVDVIQRDLVRDERVDVDVALEVEVDQRGHLVAALDAPEGGAANA